MASSYLRRGGGEITWLHQEGGETFVDLRAVSRATGLDLGQNRRFIEAFLADLDLAMSGLETIEAG